MRSLEARLSRLEKKRKAKSARAPSLAEYLDASFRQRTRNLASAYGKLDPDLPGRMLSDKELAMLENDDAEQREKDADVLRRSEGVHCPTADETAGHATAARLRLRGMKRVTVGRPE